MTDEKFTRLCEKYLNSGYKIENGKLRAGDIYFFYGVTWSNADKKYKKQFLERLLSRKDLNALLLLEGFKNLEFIEIENGKISGIFGILISFSSHELKRFAGLNALSSAKSDLTFSGLRRLKVKKILDYAVKRSLVPVPGSEGKYKNGELIFEGAEKNKTP